MSYNLLKGKKGLIFGALNEDSIAWKVAERAVEEGAEIVLTNTPVSIRMGTINQLAEACGAIVVPADATSVPDLENLIEKTMEHFGGKFDFILHSIGMSPNVRKGRTYDDLDYDFLTKTLDISAISFHKVIQVARKKDALNDWASIVALSYIAAQRTLYGYNDMADAKALLESIARSFGYIYGREKFVRINTVSQSPTPTTAGKGVLVCFCDSIYSGRDVQKVNTYKTDAFNEQDLSCLGYMRDEECYFMNQSLAVHTTASCFDVSELTALPRVDVLSFYA